MTTVTATPTVRDIPGVGRLEFVESDTRRDYWLLPEGGKRRTRLPSVTSVINATWPKPGLLAWYLKHGSDAPRLRDAAAERGKLVHSFVEAYMRDEWRPITDYPTDTWPYLKGAARFLADFNPVPIAVERLVCHPEFQYAGRLDLIAEIAGKPTLVDFKTNAEGRIFPEAHIQATAYAIANERCGDERISDFLLVGIGGEGTYNAVAGVDATQQWASMRAFYHDIQRLKKVVNGGA